MHTADSDLDLLAAYATGALSEGMSLLMASHLTFRPEARNRVARIEAVGGAMLAGCEPVAPSDGCRAGALARVTAEADPDGSVEREARDHDAVLPAPLRERIGASSDAIRWRFLLPGLSEYRLAGFDGEEVKLLRAKPGVKILQHTHAGQEATLILTGAMRDGAAVYERGDVSIADESDDHHPEIVGSDVCVCLVVLSGKMRFTGPMGRALNLFAG